MAGIIQALTFYLASPIDATQTSIQVRGLKDSRGNVITAMPSGVTILYATIEPRSPSNQEIISFTGITDNGNNIVTLTGVSRNLNPQPPFTALTPNVAHGNNAEVILSNNPPFYSGFLQADANVTITGNYQFPTPTSPNNAATKQYVDGIAISGAADADLVTKGVARLSLDPAVTLGTATISIASPAVVTFNSHNLTVNDSIKFTTSGSLPTGLLPNTTYYVIATGLTANTFQLSGSLGGTAINTSGVQSGTHTLIRTTPKAVGDNDPRLPSAAQIANIPSAGEKAALAGTQGVPAAGNKYVTQDNVFADVDQSQTTNNATEVVGEANATLKKFKIAQSFVAGKTKLRGFAVQKVANTGTFTGTVTFSLQADSAGSPSGSALASLTYSNTEYNSLPVGEIQALFASEYTSLVAGTTYWLVIETSTADTLNHPNIGVNSAGGYASGVCKYFNVTDGWVTNGTIDIYFKTLGGTVSQVGVPTRVDTFTANGVYYKPAGAKSISVIVVGGGGSGAAASETCNGGGGAAAQIGTFDASVIGAFELITVGLGGASVGVGSNGNNGGLSSFGTRVTAGGGGGGARFSSGDKTGGGGGVLGSAALDVGGAPNVAADATGPKGPSGAAAASRNAEWGGGTGGWGNGSNAGGSSIFACGGGGGAANAGNATAGGTVGSYTAGGGGAGGVSGTPGTAGRSNATLKKGYGGEGGGGGGNANGGAGGFPGGGGGASFGATSGKGGDGVVTVITYF